MRAGVIVSTLLFAIASAGGAAPTGDDLVKASLQADTAGIEAGKPFRVGVHLKIDPGYHVYWLNPGDSGEPPQVKWTLPTGFSAGELQWPVPTQFNLPGGLVNYGYDEEVMLIATITPSEESRGDTVQIRAEITWLVCNDDLCLPGAAQVNLPLKQSMTSPANTEVFARWLAELPQPVEAARGVKVKTGATPSTGLPTEISADVQWPERVRKVAWFPLPPDGVSVTGSELQSDGLHTSVKAQLKSTGGAAANAPFSSVLSYTAPGGERRGITIEFKSPHR